MSGRHIAHAGTLAVMLSLSVALLAAGPAQAKPGDLDRSFGSDGTVTTSIGSRHASDWGDAMAIDGRGRIVVAGAQFLLARYLPDGSLDPSFGNDGLVRTHFGENARSVAIDDEGRIVVAGDAVSDPATNTYSFALARYRPDGSLDPSFGDGGEVTTPFQPGDGYAKAVKIDSSGRIVAVGYRYAVTARTSTYQFALARYHRDGSLDQSFGGDGKVITRFDYGFAEAAAIDNRGRIVAAGYTGQSFTLVRYMPGGGLDRSFGGDGIVVTHGRGIIYSLAIDAHGRIVAAGARCCQTDFALARYEPEGSLDRSFGGDGIVRTRFSGNGAGINAVTLGPRGRIVAAGFRYDSGGDPDFALARYRPGGHLDASFGRGGKVATDFGATDSANAVGIDSRRRIVAVGSRDKSFPKPGAFALARYIGVPPRPRR